MLKTIFKFKLIIVILFFSQLLLANDCVEYGKREINLKEERKAVLTAKLLCSGRYDVILNMYKSSVLIAGTEGRFNVFYEKDSEGNLKKVDSSSLKFKYIISVNGKVIFKKVVTDDFMPATFGVGLVTEPIRGSLFFSPIFEIEIEVLGDDDFFRRYDFLKIGLSPRPFFFF